MRALVGFIPQCMQDAQAYPPEHGEAILECWKAHVADGPPQHARASEDDGVSDSDSEYRPREFPLAKLDLVAKFLQISTTVLQADCKFAA